MAAGVPFNVTAPFVAVPLNVGTSWELDLRTTNVAAQVGPAHASADESDVEFDGAEPDQHLEPRLGWQVIVDRTLKGQVVADGRGYQNAGNACALDSVFQLIGASHGAEEDDTLSLLVEDGDANEMERSLCELLAGRQGGHLTGSIAGIIGLDEGPQEADRQGTEQEAGTHDPVVVMRRVLSDRGEWADSVSVLDGATGHRDQLGA
jgi:hypothetical protein